MKSFELRFAACLKNFEGTDKPIGSRKELSLYADFIELATLFSVNLSVSVGDILDRFFGTEDYESSEYRDRDEAFVKSIFGLIDERIILYRKAYPFSLSADRDVLNVNEGMKNSDNQRSYVLLLIAAHLNIFSPFQSMVTREFETVSAEALKNFLPKSAVVKEFGKNSMYQGNAIVKIKRLTKEVGLDVKEYELSQVSERNNQERGLDVVAWIPFKDDCKNVFLILAQCSCGKDTESKYHDVRRFKRYIDFYVNSPQLALFVPYSMIDIRNKKFYNSASVEDDFLIFERKRLIDFFPASKVIHSLQSNRIVSLIIEKSESLW